MPGLNIDWHLGGLPLHSPTPNGDSKLRTLSWNNHTAPASVNGWILPEEDVEDEMETVKGSTAANGYEAAERPAIHRKSSSPMMPAFMTSAPGKVIVYGEHAVVYGKAAMAAAISLRSYLLVTALSKSHRTITLRFPDIDMEHTWKVDELPWSTFSQPSKKKYYYDLVDKLDPELVEAMQPHLSIISPKASPEDRKIHQNAASAFLYLFLSLASRNFPGCVYTLRSTIPIGAGLGSSASISVCLSSAILLQLRTLSGPHTDQPREEAELQIERINRWAFVGEMCIHGNPSGVDNTVATGGKAVVFKRGDYSGPPTVTPLRSFPELPLLLVNTRQSRSTSTEVAKVAALRKSQPAVVELILEAISQITASAHTLISKSNFDPKDAGSVQTLGDLMKTNHGLLAALGVSHPKLERIRDIVDTVGAGWTKLTGAGGGGSAITLLNSTASPSTLQSLEEALANEGFEKYETTLGGDGVGVLWPAVLHNGSEDENGEEIDQEMFMKADGRDGVERLVGVGAGAQEKREGWKFWSNTGGPHVNSEGKQEPISGAAVLGLPGLSQKARLNKSSLSAYRQLVHAINEAADEPVSIPPCPMKGASAYLSQHTKSKLPHERRVQQDDVTPSNMMARSLSPD